MSRDAAAAAAFAAVAAFRAALVAHDKRRRSDLTRRGYYVPPPPPPPLPPTAAGTGNTVAAYLPLPLVPAVLSASSSLGVSPTGQPLTPAHVNDIAYAARRCVDTATLGRLFRAAPPSIGLVAALVAVGKALVRDVTVLLPPPPVLPLPVAPPSDPGAKADAAPPLPATLSVPAGSTGTPSAYGDGPSAGASSVCPVVWDDSAATSSAGLPQVPLPYPSEHIRITQPLSFHSPLLRHRPRHHATHVDTYA